VQIGIVVRDLEATMRTYVEEYGLGPWEIHEFHPENLEDFHEYGRPVGRSWRLASTMVGQVQWELIQPLDDESIYARFLAEKGEGVHHIAVTAPSFDDLVAAEAQHGRKLPLSGTFGGWKVAYLDTEHSLGVMTEIYKPPPSEA
jgi:Glyoxalase/Bleomycin resistance protein/Dioxygenase superfamily